MFGAVMTGLRKSVYRTWQRHEGVAIEVSLPSWGLAGRWLWGLLWNFSCSQCQ